MCSYLNESWENDMCYVINSFRKDAKLLEVEHFFSIDHKWQDFGHQGDILCSRFRKKTTSFIHSRTSCHFPADRMIFIVRWNELGLLRSPKSMRIKQCNPWCRVKAVLSLSNSSISTSAEAPICVEGWPNRFSSKDLIKSSKLGIL